MLVPQSVHHQNSLNSIVNIFFNIIGARYCASFCYQHIVRKMSSISSIPEHIQDLFYWAQVNVCSVCRCRYLKSFVPCASHLLNDIFSGVCVEEEDVGGWWCRCAKNSSDVSLNIFNFHIMHNLIFILLLALVLCLLFCNWGHFISIIAHWY